jgi:hypothetical protein
MNADWNINKVTEEVIGCAYRVGTALGAGLLEKVYENALVVELRIGLLINFGGPSVQVKRIVNGI